MIVRRGTVVSIRAIAQGVTAEVIGITLDEMDINKARFLVMFRKEELTPEAWDKVVKSTTRANSGLDVDQDGRAGVIYREFSESALGTELIKAPTVEDQLMDPEHTVGTWVLSDSKRYYQIIEEAGDKVKIKALANGDSWWTTKNAINRRYQVVDPSTVPQGPSK
jgi:hypothetical protein